MPKSRTIRHLVSLIALTLLALVACSPSAQPTERAKPRITPEAVSAAGAPTMVLPTPDWARLSALPAAQDASDGPRALKVWLRDEIGLREQLGPEADELFRLLDQAESEAVRDVLEQLKPSGKPKGMPAPLPPRIGRPQDAQQFAAFIEALSVLNDAPNLISRPEYRDWSEPPTAKESTKQLGENVWATVKVQPTVSGCHAEMDVDLTLHAEKDGVVYEDKAKGHLSMTICPDEAGQVPLDFNLTGTVNVKDVRIHLEIVDHAIGHVDDEGNLVSIDENLETALDMPTGKNWFTGAPTNSSVRFAAQITRSGLNSADPNGASISVTGSQVLDASFPPSQEVANAAAKMGVFMVSSLEDSAFKKAQEKWRDNYCVKIQGVDESQHVLTGSETPFTARVRQEWEGKDLTVPVIATLTEGDVSVTPAGTKVPAPATFRYKAPDESSFHPAVVELISRSRRGIAKLKVAFHIQDKYYRVDSVFGLYSYVPVFGDICALDKPFKLKVDGNNPSGGKYEGEFAFTPADATSGSWKHTATSCMPGICGAEAGSSTYHVEGIAEDKPVIKMDATMASSTVKGYTGTWPWPAWQIELKPRTGICSPVE